VNPVRAPLFAMPRDSVARRFFRSAFLIFVLFAITLTSVLIAETLWVARENLKAELAIYQRTFEKSLSAAVWSMDREKLESIVRGIIEIPVVEGVRISDPTTGAVMLQAGKFPSVSDDAVHPMAHRFDVIHEDGFGREVVAKAEFQSSYGQLLRRTQRQIVLIVILAVLKTFAFWGIFLWVGRRLLAEPLTEMTEKIQATSVPKPLQLSMETEKAIADTELGLLRQAYDNLTVRIDAGRDELARENDELRRQLAELQRKD
jgi:hypothetical protein